MRELRRLRFFFFFRSIRVTDEDAMYVPIDFRKTHIHSAKCTSAILHCDLFTHGQHQQQPTISTSTRIRCYSDSVHETAILTVVYNSNSTKYIHDIHEASTSWDEKSTSQLTINEGETTRANKPTNEINSRSIRVCVRVCMCVCMVGSWVRGDK